MTTEAYIIGYENKLRFFFLLFTQLTKKLTNWLKLQLEWLNRLTIVLEKLIPIRKQHVLLTNYSNVFLSFVSVYKYIFYIYILWVFSWKNYVLYKLTLILDTNTAPRVNFFFFLSESFSPTFVCLLASKTLEIHKYKKKKTT